MLAALTVMPATCSQSNTVCYNFYFKHSNAAIPHKQIYDTAHGKAFFI